MKLFSKGVFIRCNMYSAPCIQVHFRSTRLGQTFFLTTVAFVINRYGLLITGLMCAAVDKEENIKKPGHIGIHRGLYTWSIPTNRTECRN